MQHNENMKQSCTAGLDPARSGRRSNRLAALRSATTLPANADRDRGGKEFDHRLPAASRPGSADHPDLAAPGKRTSL
jgi:hypothetical protein